MEFDKRLERAIVRGKQTRDSRSRALAEQAISEEELKALHSKCRIELSERIEQCLKKIAEHFPGFRFQTIVGEEGWGARISRDDFLRRSSRPPENVYSRLEMLIRPYSPAHIVELVAKATIRNKEVLNRAHFHFLSDVDLDSFAELIDLWALDYAEQFSSRT
jgi:hypothetical protein